MAKEIKMKDIADRLGISIVAVSKALSGKSGVSEKLRARVKRTAEEMGYQYDPAARHRSERSSNVAVLVAERYMKEDSFYFKFLRQISMVLQVSGQYALFHAITKNEEESVSLPEVIFRQRVDGIIVLGQISDKYISAVMETKIPTVFLDFYNEQVCTDCIIFDSFYASYEMTNYLIKNGHRNIAFVGNIHATSSIQDRYLGYAKSLIEHGIPLSSNYILSDRDETGKWIPIELPVVMPTAFVCNCDEVAYLLINQLKNMGYKIPENISVTGFDNSVYSELSDPSITTIEVNAAYMAKLAVEGLLQKIKKGTFSMGMVHVNGNIIFKNSVRSLNYR